MNLTELVVFAGIVVFIAAVIGWVYTGGLSFFLPVLITLCICFLIGFAPLFAKFHEWLLKRRRSSDRPDE